MHILFKQITTICISKYIIGRLRDAQHYLKYLTCSFFKFYWVQMHDFDYTQLENFTCNN